jgi:hypothetical protein
MADEDLVLDIHVDRRQGLRVHMLPDNIPVNCTGSLDCQFCLAEKRNLIKKWLNHIPYPTKKREKWLRKKIPPWAIGKTREMICRKCRKEVTPCYQCTKMKCAEWFDEKERIGQIEGCRWFFEGYCTYWQCTRSRKIIKAEVFNEKIRP